LVSKVLSIANISNFRLDPNINNYILHFPDNLYNPDGELKVSLELTNTTPYNIFVEIAKLFNAIIQVNYSVRPFIVNFINKDFIAYKGVKLFPNVNLSNFSYNDKGDNLYNIMHVSGGETATGEYVSIVPSMPLPASKLLIETSFESAYLDTQPEFTWGISHAAPDYYILKNTDDKTYKLYIKPAPGDRDHAEQEMIQYTEVSNPMF
jgi:hypothetical protein